MPQKPTKKQQKEEFAEHIRQGHIPLGPMAKANAAKVLREDRQKEIRKSQLSQPMVNDATVVKIKDATVRKK